MVEKSWEGHTGNVLDSVNTFDVIDCMTCRFRHIIPIPTDAELREIYQHTFYSNEKPFYIERCIEDLDWWDLVYRERYDTLEKLLPGNRRKILDIGSGPGLFLQCGKRRGWETLGIEPSSQAVEYSRSLGLNILHEFITDEISRNIGTFDVIHADQVLEHISDPRHLISIMYTLLHPDGLVCVIVPNDYNPIQEALRKVNNFPPWWVSPPQHINYFTYSSLSSLLEQSGFRILVKEATFPIDIFLLMGDNYVGNDTVGRICHKKRKNMERILDLAGLSEKKRMLYRFFTEMGIGRELMIIAKK